MEDITLQKEKTEVKDMLKAIRSTTDYNEVTRLQKEFEHVLSRVRPVAIALAEQELLQEGYTFEDLQTACDVHLALFRNTIAQNRLDVPEDHPISRFQKEHEAISAMMEKLRGLFRDASKLAGMDEAMPMLKEAGILIARLLQAENHNVRQENTLFPILEKHGVSAPPAIMWAEHTEMKEEKKDLKKSLEALTPGEFPEAVKKLESKARVLYEQFLSHTQKETHILYHTALEVITADEWKDIKEECDNLGYFDLSL